MNKRGAGVIYYSNSYLFVSSKYISAAIFGSGVLSWDEFLFHAMLNYVGLSMFSIIALIIGGA